MLNCLIKTLVIYVSVICVMRILGKRQIGDLQPAELVITILLSDIFSIPLQEPDLPMLNMIIPVFLLVGLELIVSFVTLKSSKVRKLFQGKYIPVIENGTLNQKNLKLIRFTVEDLMEELRKKDVFDISEVEYAVVETDGSLSVLKKQDGIPSILVVADGRILTENAGELSLGKAEIEAVLKEKGYATESVFVLTADRDKNYTLIKSEEKK
ncbi:MAG: DUF421 domain-containing protein [Clostridia bacterium]|nr:DUF421 domain-containing protein [Clostridia bacterium]